MLDLVALVLQIALIVLVIRLYRVERKWPFAWFMGASICFVLTSALVWAYATIEIMSGADRDSPQSPLASAVGEYAKYVFSWLTLICLIVAAVLFLRDRRRDPPTI